MNGVFLPESAQRASRWGKILSRGPQVDQIDQETTIVCFNPAMTMPGLEDSRGEVAFDVIHQEAVVAQANDAFGEAANLVFTMPDVGAMAAALGAKVGATVA